MKKLLLFTMLMIGSLTFSQTINDIPLSNINQKYIKVIASIKVGNNKTTISYDLGKNFKEKEVLKDVSGNTIEFNSVIDALNLFSEFGYKIVTSDVVAGSTSYIYHYILEKS